MLQTTLSTYLCTFSSFIFPCCDIPEYSSSCCYCIRVVSSFCAIPSRTWSRWCVNDPWNKTVPKNSQLIFLVQMIMLDQSPLISPTIIMILLFLFYLHFFPPSHSLSPFCPIYLFSLLFVWIRPCLPAIIIFMFTFFVVALPHPTWFCVVVYWSPPPLRYLSSDRLIMSMGRNEDSPTSCTLDCMEFTIFLLIISFFYWCSSVIIFVITSSFPHFLIWSCHLFIPVIVVVC